MQKKKILPLAVALAAAAVVTAGASELPQRTQVQQYCARYGVSFCGGLKHCPALRPETPDLTPDASPDQTPDLTPTPTPTPDATPDAALSGYAAEVVRLVNAERAKNGLPALSVDTKVQRAAQVRASEQAQLFSHTRPNGASCFTALTEAGVSYRGAGENIAYGQTSPAAVMNAWMNSEGHRKNILNANFTTIGVGYTTIGGTAYWAQLFTY